MNHRGVSLPLAVGLVLFLMIASASVHQLVIRTLRSSQQIEAAARAQAIAEAGLEDALYELSGHFAGYETPDVSDPGARQTIWGTSGVRWDNRWQISSDGLLDSGCQLEGEPVCGELRENRKTVFSLFRDQSTAPNRTDIQTLNLNDLVLRFRISGALGSSLVIDNDDDNNVNEDGRNDAGTCPGTGGRPVSGRDADCDDRQDEDSAEDPLIFWKFSDNAGNSLIPRPGCLNETDAALPLGGSELCEKNFTELGGDFLLEVDWMDLEGLGEDGNPQSVEDFLNEYATDPTMRSRQLQLELLVVAPLEQVDTASSRHVPIPFIGYEVDALTANGALLPDPLFVIQSDGYYQDFKQSITTTLTPRTTVPLGDFTLIQQE